MNKLLENGLFRFVVTATVPIIFGIGFTMLSIQFDYPQILRQPAHEVLDKFSESQSSIMIWWWAMFSAALLFVPTSVLVAHWVGISKTFGQVVRSLGLASALVQAIGLSRWVFAIPVIAAGAQDEAIAKSAGMMFDILNSWIGMGIGEWAGYLFTGLWSLSISLSLYSKSRWLSILGATISIGILLGLLEIFGVPVAGPINALSYSAWIIWMLILAGKLAKT